MPKMAKDGGEPIDVADGPSVDVLRAQGFEVVTDGGDDAPAASDPAPEADAEETVVADAGDASDASDADGDADGDADAGPEDSAE